MPIFVWLNYNICFNFIYNLWYCSGKPKRVRWYTHPLVFSNDCKYFLFLNRFKVIGRMNFFFFFWVQIHGTNLIWISHYTWTRTKDFHNVITLFAWGSYKSNTKVPVGSVIEKVSEYGTADQVVLSFSMIWVIITSFFSFPS